MIFTIDKVMLDEAKAKALKDLAKTTEVYNRILIVGRQWQDNYIRWSHFITDLSFKLGGLFFTE